MHQLTQQNNPALDIIHLLEEKGAKVSYYDPHVPAFQYEGMEMVGVTNLDLALRLADCVVIVTNHAAYKWNITLAVDLYTDTRHVLIRTSLQECTIYNKES